MPWLESAPMDQRLDFLTAHRRGGYAMAELCARFGISRKTGYKRLARYDAERAFTAFRTEYNAERPHSALGGATPASCYLPASRSYPARLAPFSYPAHYTVRMVTTAGTIRLRSKLLFIAHALTHEYIGIEEIDDGLWSIYVGPMLLARVSERDFILRG